MYEDTQACQVVLPLEVDSVSFWGIQVTLYTDGQVSTASELPKHVVVLWLALLHLNGPDST